MRAKDSRVVEIFILTKLGIGRGLLIDRRRLVAKYLFVAARIVW